MKFVMTDTGTRYNLLLSDDSDAVADLAQTDETRNDSLVEYAGSGWIWNYDDDAERVQVAPTLIALTTEDTPELITRLHDVEIPLETEDPSLEALSSPIFCVPGGSHDIAQFSLPVDLTNPNGVGTLVYAITSRPEWEFQIYSGTLWPEPGDTIIAYIASPDVYEFGASNFTFGKFKGAYFPKPLTGATDEETPLTKTAYPAGTDPDKIDITFSITGLTPPSKGSASFSDGIVTFTPGVDFQYLGEGLTATETF